MTLFGMRPLNSEGLCMCISHSRFPLHTPQNSEMVIERIPKGSRSVERHPSGIQLRGTSEKRLHVVTCSVECEVTWFRVICSHNANPGC